MNPQPSTLNPQPSTLKRSGAAYEAYQDSACRCFYCQALLILTDPDARHCVCSNNCPSRIVTLDPKQVIKLKRAWRYQKQIDEHERTQTIDR